MGDATHARQSREGSVLHVVGSVTDEVFSFLGPATRALARAGRQQIIVMVDDSRYRHNLAQMDESAELILVARLKSAWTLWRTVYWACRSALNQGSVQAVHLHGLVACVAGALAVRAAGLPVPIVYSPHGSRSLGGLRLVGKAIWPVVRPFVRPSGSSAIVSVPQEARSFKAWKNTEVVESPVHDVFFATPRNEARHPLVVSGGRQNSIRTVETFAQFAVLLHGAELGVSFNWIGRVDALSQLRLTAAEVGVFDIQSEQECAERLAAGWVYVAPGKTRGFPLFLIQAMAAGLPCVALDCEQHREVIEDTRTGYLCASKQEMIGRIAKLVDDASTRADIGSAARRTADARFREATFFNRLLSAYPAATRLGN